MNTGTTVCCTRHHDPIHTNSTGYGPRDPNWIVNRGTIMCCTRCHDHTNSNSNVACSSAQPQRDHEHMTTTMCLTRAATTQSIQIPPWMVNNGSARRKGDGGRKNRNSIKLSAQRKLLRANVSFNNQTNGRKNAPV